MKKLFKRCFAIILCAVTLISFPTSAFAATSIPTCTVFTILENGGYWKLYEFEPDDYKLDAGFALELKDTYYGENGDHWLVYAGYDFFVNCWLPTPAACQFLVFEVFSNGTSTLAYTFNTSSSKDQQIRIPVKSYDAEYFIILKPKTNTYVKNYEGFVDYY